LEENGVYFDNAKIIAIIKNNKISVIVLYQGVKPTQPLTGVYSWLVCERNMLKEMKG
jgi:hypothetical protein